MKRKLLSIGALCIALGAQAGGFKVGLQGQKQIGMGHVGTGLALDASSVYFNPAAMHFTANQIVVSGTGLMARTQFLDASTQTQTNADAKFATPFAIYGTYRINKKITAGIGIYTPFGSGVSYPADWTGRYVLTAIDLKAIFVKPTVSYAITDNLVVGAGLAIATGSVTLEKDLPVQGQTNTIPGHAKLKGSANGVGFDAAVFYKKNKLSAGITYRHVLNMKVSKGDATFTNIPVAAAASFPNTTFTSTLPLPGEIAVGVGYQFTKKLLVGADYSNTFWSSFDSLGFDYNTNTASLTDAKSPRLFKNASTFRVGAQYNATKKMALRAGYFYDMTPVIAGYINPETPDNNKHGVTAGLTYMVNYKLSIDASLMYQDVPARTQTNVVTNLGGTFATRAIAPGIGITYNFKAVKPKTVQPTPAK